MSLTQIPMQSDWLQIIKSNFQKSISRRDSERTLPFSVICQSIHRQSPRHSAFLNRKSESVGKKPLVDPSESSLDLQCTHFDTCSGCSIDSSLHQPPVLADAKQFFHSYGVLNFSLSTGDVHSWRCRAKLAVRKGYNGKTVIGLFEEGSHKVVDIPSCKAHHPSLNDAVALVKNVIAKTGVEPFDEVSGSGSLRYIQMVLTTNDTSVPQEQRYLKGRVQLSLVVNARDDKAGEAQWLRPFVNEIWRLGGPSSPRPILHSVWANFQTSRSNVIFGGKWRHLVGPPVLWQKVGKVDVAFAPGGFGQANYKAFDVLLSRLHRLVPLGSLVTELYAGTGVIGLTLAVTRKCRRVRCVEVNPACESAFQLSVKRLPKDVAVNISWHCADANEGSEKWLRGSEVLIVDPPRKGLDPTVMESLIRVSDRAKRSAGRRKLKELGQKEEIWPHTLIYVSCGWQAFKRDCLELTKSSNWTLASAEAVQFFPGTNSMEVLATFSLK